MTELNWTPNSRSSLSLLLPKGGGTHFLGLLQQITVTVVSWNNKIYLTVLQTKSLKLIVSHSCEKKSIPCLFQHLTDANCPWCSLPCEHITVMSVFTVISPLLLAFRVYLPPPLILLRMHVMALWAPWKIQANLFISRCLAANSSANKIPSAKSFQMSHSQVLGLGHGCIFWSHNQSEDFQRFWCGYSLSLHLLTHSVSPADNYVWSSSQVNLTLLCLPNFKPSFPPCLSLLLGNSTGLSTEHSKCLTYW